MSLSTLIVQREIASIREVEEALARQVLYGGDLVTNLLEVCRIDEAQLLPIVAEALGLPAAPHGELPRPPPEAQRLVAAEVAVERNLAPLSVDRYGLTVAVSQPLTAEVEQELAFALALPIAQKIAPLVRIRQALARDYGVALDRRLQRLLRRMMSDGPRASSSYPPMRNADTRLGAPRPPSIIPAAPHSKIPEPHRPSSPPGGGAKTLLRQVEQPSLRPLRRRRGAITVDVARSELEEATERDTIFDLLFEFARQYFDYTAVFIVHGELAEGRDAFGDGASRDKVARIGVPLDLPSILSVAREKKATVQRVPSADGLDAVLMSDLGRGGKTLCVVLPVIVRTRVVALLLGDGGDTGIDATTLADVEGIVAAATAAFERLIVRRKLKGSMMPGAGDSLAPKQPSMAPPTMMSEVSNRPAVEELAPAIRDLLTEPESRVDVTVREPLVRTVLPDEADGMTGGRGKTDKPPPPPNVLAVRRPSGRPIPREEPDSKQRMPAVTAPSNLGAAAQAAIRTAALEAHGVGAPSSALPRSRRRGEAPHLEFGAVPPQSSTFGSESFGRDDIERRLLAEIQGSAPPPDRAHPSNTPSAILRDSGPITDRDSHPPVVSPSNVPAPASSPASYEVEPPASPKAASPPPPPMRQAPYRTTDMSPVALDAPPAEPVEAAPVEEAPVEAPVEEAPLSEPTLQSAPEPMPMPPRSPLSMSADIATVPPPPPSPSAKVATVPPQSSEMISAEDLDVDILPDSNPWPVAPARPSSEAETPLAPLVSDEPVRSSPPLTPWPSSLSKEDLDQSGSRPVPPPFVPEAAPSKPMPASEQQISVALHRPPSSRSDHTRVLPSVIVDVASEYVGLVDRVLGTAEKSGGEGSTDAEDAEAELVRAGGYAMPAIMTRFPGPVTIEQDRLADGPLPRVAECGPILRVIASQRRTALPFVLSHVEDPEVEKRFWATYLLTELVYPDVLEPILLRVYDEEPRVRRAARAAARAFAEVQGAAIVERLELVAMDGGEPQQRRILAIEALGDTREPLAIPALMPLLDDPNMEIVLAVRTALTQITRQDFGTSSQKWAPWWAENKDRHRLEWLIDALMHEQAALRAAAGEELKTTTKEYFGYYDDLPKRERERAQSRYREWWNSVGKVRFSRASSSRG